MIELEQIKKTDTVKQLRGQLNTAFNEIVADQPMIGAVLNPSITFYRNDSLIGSATANYVTNHLSALVLPENNGCYVAAFYGVVQCLGSQISGTRGTFNQIKVDIPAIKCANASASYTTFLTPKHLGLPCEENDDIYLNYIGCDIQLSVKRMLGTLPSHTCAVLTNSSSTNTLEIAIAFDNNSLSLSEDTVVQLSF